MFKWLDNMAHHFLKSVVHVWSGVFSHTDDAVEDLENSAKQLELEAITIYDRYFKPMVDKTIAEDIAVIKQNDAMAINEAKQEIIKLLKDGK